jgi:hypothetical protein
MSGSILKSKDKKMVNKERFDKFGKKIHSNLKNHKISFAENFIEVREVENFKEFNKLDEEDIISDVNCPCNLI